MQTVLITGAASGMGRATAQMAAARGWRCVLLDRDEVGLESLAQRLPGATGGPHVPMGVDLTDGAAVRDLVPRLPKLDALINNAGMSESTHLPLTDQPYEHLDRVLKLNLHAPALLVRALESRLTTGARVVNVTSGAGFRAIPWRGLYSPSKAGLMAQTLALAQARPQWCVTALSPGFVRTALVDGLIQAGRLQAEAAVAKVPLGRMATPDEMAHALCFLASPDAVGLSGQVLALDGGSSVFGGSQACRPTATVPFPLDAPVDWSVQGDAHENWSALPSNKSNDAAYPACVEMSTLRVPGTDLLRTAHAAATRFVDHHTERASLTLLLPQWEARDWQDAGTPAALRMLVATLACEWGMRGLRINALVVPTGTPPQALVPALHYLGGPAAQYLTGQILSWQAKRSWEGA